MKYIDAEKLIAEIERRKNQTERRLDNIVPIRRKDTMDDEQLAKIELRDKVDKAYLNGALVTLSDILSFITSLQQEQPETDMKSPFTGGKVAILSRQEEVTFRGEKVKILRKYYRCEDTGREFTNDKLDDDMMWAVFRAYCGKKGITSFADIMLKQEQPEVDMDAIVNEAFDKYSSVDGYGQLSVSFNRAELYSFIKKITRKE